MCVWICQRFEAKRMILCQRTSCSCRLDWWISLVLCFRACCHSVEFSWGLLGLLQQIHLRQHRLAGGVGMHGAVQAKHKDTRKAPYAMSTRQGVSGHADRRTRPPPALW